MDVVKSLLDKISSYNILTNIIPGAVLCVSLKYLVGYDLFADHDWFTLGVIFYIVGVINNRFSSVVISPFLNLIHFVKPCPYKDFIKAETIDAKVAVLNAENNVFRSYISVCCLLLVALLYKTTLSRWGFLSNNITVIALTLIAVLFALSYRKQTKIISQRVKIDRK